MATPRYKLMVTLHHHTDTITALQFSPCGSYLASGSDDGVVFIFSTESWNPVKRFIDVSPVTSLLWHPSFPKTIICGFNSGDIHTACFEGSDMVRLLCWLWRSLLITVLQVESGSLRKVWSDPMNGAVHCMAFNQEGTMMGIGHGAELSIVRAKTICACQSLPSSAHLE
jgi:WD40 repeat protein